MLYRLLKLVPSKDYILVSSQDYSNPDPKNASLGKLSADYYHLKTPQKAKKVIQNQDKKPLWQKFSSFVATVKVHQSQLKKILVGEDCDTLVVCSGGFFEMPSAYLATRGLKIRFIIYSFDDFVYQWTGSLRIVARAMAFFAFRRADELIVPNEFLRIAYRKRFKKNSIVIRNPLLPVFKENKKKYFSKNDLNIIYTGSIYSAHYDAFNNLTKALELIEIPARIHLYTTQSARELSGEGVSGKNVIIHGNFAQSEIFSIQKQADILFLPLAFHSPIRETIRTSAPGKMAEYLFSGRPILVHAPRDSYLSWYFKRKKCGLVVDTLNQEALAEAIVSLSKRTEQVKQFQKNALRCAKVDFSIDLARKSFLKVVGGR